MPIKCKGVDIGLLPLRCSHKNSKAERLYNLGVEADGHELMIPQRIMRPSIAPANDQNGPSVQIANIYHYPQSATPH